MLTLKALSIFFSVATIALSLGGMALNIRAKYFNMLLVNALTLIIGLGCFVAALT